MNSTKVVAYIAFGFAVGVTAGLSFLRTEWNGYQVDFFSWWTAFSTVLGIVFLMGNVAQYVALQKEKELISKEKEIHKSQVKVWQHHANGIETGLFIIVYKAFTSIDDIKIAVEAVYQVARTLHTSLHEERLFTDAEIKEKFLQKEKEQADLVKAVQARNAQAPETNRN
jgi:hypothetical protein